MGVMTDATGRLLVNAVGGVDTSGLVKDTTVQTTNSKLDDIKTAINTISSAISPAANNVTYNNTTSGLAASNVQVAIDELSVEKQDIIIGGVLDGPDFDDLIENKNYWIKLTGSTNGPNTDGFGYLEVIVVSVANNGLRMQRFTKFASNGTDMCRTYIRHFVNNRWYNWVQTY